MSKKNKDEELRANPPEDGGEGSGGEGGEGAAEGEGAPKSKKKLIIIIAAVLILLVGGGGAGLYFSGMLGKKDAAAEGEAAGEHGEAGHGAEGEHEKAAEKCKEGEKCNEAYFLQIPNMLVNLSSVDGQNRYLRLNVQLELKSEADKAAVEAVMPRVVDQFQTYLRELRVKDLRGSAGIYRLQMELLNRVNTAAAPIEVKDVLFQEILIQ